MINPRGYTYANTCFRHRQFMHEFEASEKDFLKYEIHQILSDFGEK